MHFLRPYWLLALIPLGFLVFHLIHRKIKTSPWNDVCDAHLLPYLLIDTHHKKQLWTLGLMSLGWLLSVLALAGPTWSRLPQPLYRASTARVVVLDLSTTMYATDVKPNRLSRAKYKLLDILNHSDEGQTGLVVYSDEPFVVSPLTEDAKTITTMVSELEPNILPVQGHRIAPALAQAAALLKQVGVHHGDIILITGSSADTESMKLASKLRAENIHTSVLGIGSQQGAPVAKQGGGFVKDSKGNIMIAKLDSVSLTKLATAGGGRYITYTHNDRDINLLLNTSTQTEFNKKTKAIKEKTQLWKDEGVWLVIFLLPIAVMVFRRGWFKAILK